MDVDKSQVTDKMDRKKYLLIAVVFIIAIISLSYRHTEIINIYELENSSETLNLKLEKHFVIGIEIYQFKSITTRHTSYESNVLRFKRKQREPLNMYTFDVERNPREDKHFYYWTTVKLSHDLSYIYINGSKTNKLTGYSSSENFSGRFLIEVNP